MKIIPWFSLLQVQIDDSPEVKYNQVSLYTLLMSLQAKGFRSQTIILPMLEHFLHISLLTLHNNYDMKFPYATITCIFPSSSKLECGIQEFYSREIHAHLHFWHFNRASDNSREKKSNFAGFWGTKWRKNWSMSREFRRNLAGKQSVKKRRILWLFSGQISQEIDQFCTDQTSVFNVFLTEDIICSFNNTL